MRKRLFKIKAIFYCLWFGILPYWFYEKTCHYKGMSYFGHLWLNIEQALIWLSGRQTLDDIIFEIKVNKQGASK